MASTIRCDIVSAEEEIFHGEAQLVVATGEEGELGIAPRHAPLITRLKPGKLVLTLANGEKVDIVVSGGILEVQPQVISVLADTAIRAENIDELSVLKAKQEGQAALERARGESAALRNLANAARLIEGQPALATLRFLQTLEASNTGQTFVMNDIAALLPALNARGAKPPATEPGET